MKFGTNLYKFTQFGDDLEGMVEFVQTADSLGYNHIRVLDHVVGIVLDKDRDLVASPYSEQSYIYECFTLVAYLAALTKQIRFMPAVLVLPQRQTALVAKQAASIDILTRGRLTLGVGVGYLAEEFQVMGEDFKSRGRRFEEQIAVLRAFWTENIVDFSGEWHDFRSASLAPRPIQRPIPIWFGAGRSIPEPIPADSVLRRIGRLADGWLPQFRVDEQAREAVSKVNAAAREAGRDPADIAMEMALWVEDKSDAVLLEEIKAMREMGASQLNVRFAADSVRGHIDALKAFRSVIDRYEGG